VNEDGTPPTPPQRIESLTPSPKKVPPPPPPRSFPVDENAGEPAAKTQKLDNTADIPDKPPRAHTYKTNDVYSKDYDELTDDTVINNIDTSGAKTQKFDSENNNPVDEEVNPAGGAGLEEEGPAGNSWEGGQEPASQGSQGHTADDR